MCSRQVFVFLSISTVRLNGTCNCVQAKAAAYAEVRPSGTVRWDMGVSFKKTSSIFHPMTVMKQILGFT